MIGGYGIAAGAAALLLLGGGLAWQTKRLEAAREAAAGARVAAAVSAATVEALRAEADDQRRQAELRAAEVARALAEKGKVTREIVRVPAGAPCASDGMLSLLDSLRGPQWRVDDRPAQPSGTAGAGAAVPAAPRSAVARGSAPR